MASLASPRLTSWRRRVALGARIAGVSIIIAAASGKLPHLVATQAAVSAFLTMGVAPLWLLDRSEKGVRSRPHWSIPAFPAIALMAVGTIAVQVPVVVAVLADGGLLTALALSALLLGAVAFWSVVMPPSRIRGLAACGYIVIGGVPVSMPSLLLVLAPRDLYAAFHAASPPAIGAMTDQLAAGFILFAAVKITIFTFASFVFFAAAAEGSEPEDDDGGRPVPARPTVPGWVLGLAGDAPTVEEPAAQPSVKAGKETAGAR